jgi:tetratricopeptide (TPR) repeat protein
MKARLFPLTFVFVLACALAASARQAGGEPTHRLSLPGKDWALDVALSGFKVEVIEGNIPDDVLMLVALRKEDRRALAFLIRLSPARRVGGAAEFRDFAVAALKKGNSLRAESLKTWEYKQTPVARYKQSLVSNPQLFTTDATIYTDAYFVKDDSWVTVRMVSQSFGDKEESLFRSVLDSVGFTDTTRPVTSFDYFHKGRTPYKAGDYPKAAERYRAAFELERKERRLSVELWRALVEQLANSYAANRDYARAREVLEYGLAHEPARFRFNYNLARVYAAQDDLDNTVAFLEKAAHNKKHHEKAPALSPPPDPLNDPVFARFKKVDKFKKAAKAVR